MLALLQRVSEAEVCVLGKSIAQISQGLLVFCGFEPQDDEALCLVMLNKILKYRLFSDQQGKMNLSLKDIQGGLLLVPQFTLAADTNTGLRPSFSSAASPEQGQHLFSYLSEQAYTQFDNVACGEFGAHMSVRLCNDGPATFLLKS